MIKEKKSMEKQRNSSKHMPLFVKHGGMYGWQCKGSLLFTDNVTADSSIRMNSEF